MSKKALFYCRINRDNLADAGIIRKCEGQVKALRNLGYDVDFLWLCTEGVLLNDNLLVRTWLPLRPNSLISYAFYYCLFHLLTLKKINLEGYDLLFGRYELSHPYLIYFLKKFRKKNLASTIILEIPTYPYHFEMRGWLRRLQYWMDKLWRKKLKQYINFIVTPGYNQSIFGIPAVHMPNGIDVQSVPMANGKGNDATLTLVGVGHWQWWHGLDRLVKGLSVYCQNAHAYPKINIRLIGSTEHLPWLQERIGKAGLRQHITIHAPVMGNELDEFFEGADLAVGLLAGAQKGLQCAFPLKHREYACRGLPFIYSLPDPDLEAVEDCLIRLPNDDSPVDFELVISKWKKLGKNCRERLRNHALQHFDWTNVMQRMFAKVNGEVEVQR